MKRTELKRIGEYLWKPTTSDEKLPFAQKSTAVLDNGAITKNLPLKAADDNGGIPNKFQAGEEEKPSEMSMLRKLCFFLSLNIGLLYIATFAWILPCNEPMCLPHDFGWTLNFSDVYLTSNLDTSISTSPQLLFYGYVNNRTGNLAGVAAKDGEQAWNRVTQFIPRHVFCHFASTFDVNEDDIPDCLVVSDGVVEAFNTSNGETLWRHNMLNSRSHSISSVHPTSQGKRNSLFLIYGQSLFVIDISASSSSEILIPCQDSLETKLSPWVVSSNDTLWYLKCDFGDNVEVWTFLEAELLHFAGSGGNADGFLGFSVLLSGNHYNRSMVLVSDVTATSDSLALSWADTVVMVTSQAPFHSIQKTWERILVDPLGLPLSITSITNGCFTNLDKTEIAVAVQVESNAKLYILNWTNGSTVNSVSLGKRKIIKIERTPRTQKPDSLLVECIPNEPSNRYKVNISDPEPMDLQRSYLLVDFSSATPVITNIFQSSSVLDATTSVDQNGDNNLLLAIEMSDGFSLISKPSSGAKTTDGKNCDLSPKHEL